ncbi:amidohydrolase family protein [Asticcacaulis biprosthecium C19]|uniref:Amidohydrolase family protein n=1 Tax=Asticcacaulis biprosthecium C19 TaxID=715226 RepID=F4QKP5_9CAUL|nr:amidohydrolase family protein [Asticcacaulis biprosthecium]EGF93347.1 amidohydrolase family protein [Asticcacaulis biprosthecium C19]
MIIDAHQHLWHIGRNDQSWPTPDLPEICRDFVAADLREVTADCGVTGTVLVQSQPSETDTMWLLSLAKAEPLIKAVVGWTDFAAPKSTDRIAYLSHQPKLKGLRPTLQGLDDDWILQDACRPALEEMTARGLTFDALVFTRHLSAIDRIAKDYPTLRIIIDHGGKPPIGAGQMQPWADKIAKVAENPNVACKLSGLLTEADGQPVTAYADHLFDTFGPDRLLWGSDWPVVLLKDSYRAWFDWTTTWLADKDPATRDAILGGNARRLYAFDEALQNA